MTEHIKPKQCGENTWYTPNQKGFVPEIGGEYYYCKRSNDYAGLGILRFASDYAMIEAGNCFETKQEALDAFVKPVDPTPLTWDELCEIAKDNDWVYVYMLCLTRDCHEVWSNSTRPVIVDTVHKYGRLDFEVNKYWRSKESLEAWIEQQKEILK